MLPQSVDTKANSLLTVTSTWSVSGANTRQAPHSEYVSKRRWWKPALQNQMNRQAAARHSWSCEPHVSSQAWPSLCCCCWQPTAATVLHAVVCGIRPRNTAHEKTNSQALISESADRRAPISPIRISHIAQVTYGSSQNKLPCSHITCNNGETIGPK